MRPLENSGIWRFGVFEVDARRFELRRNGVIVRLREQSFRILIYLLEHAGELVTREDLRRVLWPSDTFVDFDHSLNTAMMKLRDALGDAVEAPLYIETIPKRGYRFIAPVTEPASPTTSQSELSTRSTNQNGAPASLPQPVPPTPIETLPGQHPVVIAIATLLIVCLTTIGFLAIRHRTVSKSAARERELLRTVPVTSASGDAISPVFSPDGREISFVWDGSDRKGYDLYVQLIGAAMPLRLTYHQHGLIGTPAWSPDGREVAFERCDGKNDGVFAVPALGGEERQLTSVTCLYTLPTPVAWIAGGSAILIVDRCSPNSRFGVLSLSLGTGEKNVLPILGKTISRTAAMPLRSRLMGLRSLFCEPQLRFAVISTRSPLPVEEPPV